MVAINIKWFLKMAKRYLIRFALYKLFLSLSISTYFHNHAKFAEFINIIKSAYTKWLELQPSEFIISNWYLAEHWKNFNLKGTRKSNKMADRSKDARSLKNARSFKKCPTWPSHVLPYNYCVDFSTFMHLWIKFFRRIKKMQSHLSVSA